MEEDYKIRPKDFTPIIGLFSYANRNNKNYLPYQEFHEIEKRMLLLGLYNFPILLGCAFGLEKLIH